MFVYGHSYSRLPPLEFLCYSAIYFNKPQEIKRSDYNFPFPTNVIIFIIPKIIILFFCSHHIRIITQHTLVHKYIAVMVQDIWVDIFIALLGCRKLLVLSCMFACHYYAMPQIPKVIIISK